MNYTPNFALTQWEKTDRIRMEDFNANNFKLDQAMSGFGNCCIETGSYKGTGFYGSAKNTISFTKQPLLVWVLDLSTGAFMMMERNCMYGMYVTAWSGQPESSLSIVAWNEDNSVTWYSSKNAEHQLNLSSHQYRYIGICPVQE